MFGINTILKNQKGLIFIIDLILIVSAIVLVLIYITETKPGIITKQQYDLVYGEAQVFFTNNNSNNSVDKNKDYICRNYSNVYFDIANVLRIEDQNVCTNILR